MNAEPSTNEHYPATEVSLMEITNKQELIRQLKEAKEKNNS